MLSFYKCYDEKYSKNYLITMGIILTVAILLVVWVTLSYPKKSVRQKYINNIFNVKGAKVTKILLEPYNPSTIENKEGIQKAFYITDRNVINQFCKQLNMSVKYVPSHPTDKWACVISLYLKGSKIKFLVSQTANNQGIMIPVYSDVTTNWFYGFYRNDKLGKIILDAWEKHQN